MLTDQQLWDKCGSGQAITHNDLGIEPNEREHGLQSLKEGFDISDTNTARYEIVIVLTIVIVTAILSICLI